MSISGLGSTLQVLKDAVVNLLSNTWGRITEFFWKNVFKGMIFDKSTRSLEGRVEVLNPKADNFFIRYIKQGRFEHLLNKINQGKDLTDEEWVEFENLLTIQNITPELEEKMLSDWVVDIPVSVRQEIIELASIQRLVEKKNRGEKLTQPESELISDYVARLERKNLAQKLRNTNNDLLEQVWKFYSTERQRDENLPPTLISGLKAFFKDFEKASQPVQALFYQLDPISQTRFKNLNTIIMQLNPNNPAQEILLRLSLINTYLVDETVLNPTLEMPEPEAMQAPEGKPRLLKYPDVLWYVFSFRKKENGRWEFENGVQLEDEINQAIDGEPTLKPVEENQYVIYFPGQIVKDADQRFVPCTIGEVEFPAEPVQRFGDQALQAFKPNEDSRIRRIALELLNKGVPPSQVQTIIMYGLNQGVFGSSIKPVIFKEAERRLTPLNLGKYQMYMDISREGDVTVIYETPDIQLCRTGETEVIAHARARFEWDVVSGRTHLDYQFLRFEPEELPPPSQSPHPLPPYQHGRGG